MKYLFDTNIVIGFLNNDEQLIAKFKELRKLNIPCITVGEMLYGACNSQKSKENMKSYNDFFECCEIFDVNKHTAECYADIRHKLKSIGKPIPENDIWIAALAQENNLVLVTRDKHLLEIDFINSEKW